VNITDVVTVGLGPVNVRGLTGRSL